MREGRGQGMCLARVLNPVSTEVLLHSQVGA